MARRVVLVVDDDERVLEIAKLYLQKEGFTVITARDGNRALEQFRDRRPDLMILDLMLPGRDGWEVCREVRKTDRTPIIMLTARDDDTDKVVGLELGADDYVTKPFNPRELAARVKAVMRRVEEGPGSAEPREIQAGNLVINMTSHQVTVGDNPVDLTPRETELLWFLARHRGQVFSREQLLKLVWGYDYPGGRRTVDTHVKRLRQKLGRKAQGFSIETVWGVGYKFISEGRK